MRSGRRQRQANTSTLTCWSPSRSLLIIVPHQSNACCLCWDRADVAPMISNWTCWKKAVIATILLLAISSYQQISCIQIDETDDMIVLGEAWWSWGLNPVACRADATSFMNIYMQLARTLLFLSLSGLNCSEMHVWTWGHCWWILRERHDHL